MSDFRERVQADEGVQVIAFTLGGELHGCDVMLVEEVVTKETIHPLPDVPPRLLGLLRLRGELVPVIDVAPLLDLARDAARAPAILVVDTDGGRVGVAADQVRDVIHVPPGSYRPSPGTGGDRDAYVAGIARVEETLLTLVDLAEMLRGETTLYQRESP